MEKIFSGKVALITGGGAGMGEQLQFFLLNVVQK